MPYINRNKRIGLDANYRCPEDAGELNYVFTKIIDEYISVKKNYQRMNDVIGALDGASREFYRRVVAPYEDTKIEENGDVYGKASAGDEETKLRREGVEL